MTAKAKLRNLASVGRGETELVSFRSHSSVISKLGVSYARTAPSRSRREAARKCELLVQVVTGKLSIPAACQRYRVRQEEVQEWLRVFHRSALAGLDEHLKAALIRQGAAPEALAASELCISLEEVAIADWIQAVPLFAKQAVITITHDDTESRLWCSDGVLVDAESGALSGEAAVYDIVGLERGSVVTELRAVHRERTIFASTQGLLLEAARRRDESVLVHRRLGNVEGLFEHSPLGPRKRPRRSAEATTLELVTEPRRARGTTERSALPDIEASAAFDLEPTVSIDIDASAVDIAAPATLDSLAPVARPTEPPPPSGDPAANVPRAERSKRRPKPAFPISFVWHAGADQRFRGVLSVLSMVVAVSLAAWLGATVSRASSPIVPAPPLPIAPVPVVAAPVATAPEAHSLMVRAFPAEAALELDGVNVGAGYLTRRLPRDGTLHELRITAPGFVPARVLFVDTAPTLDIRLDPLPSPAAASVPAVAEEVAPTPSAAVPAAAVPAVAAPAVAMPQSTPSAASAPAASASPSSAPPVAAPPRRRSPAPTRRRAEPQHRAAQLTQAPEKPLTAPKARKRKKPFVQIIEPQTPGGRRN